MRSSNLESPRVSVIVSTNGRCASLANLVACLEYQRFKHFELCLVCGPKDDGTGELTRSWRDSGKIKLSYCDEANLARSRNAGLAIAAGDYVAFIDDDALPEPVWLADLVEALASSDAVGAGGLVFEPNGRQLQFRYSSCNRFGISTHGLGKSADDGAFPFSPNFPHFMGTNCMFQREAITALGGFDEEYEYYLEETDLCCRLIDQGFKLRQLDRAPVYHKFLSGTARDAAGITIKNYPILKSQLYFSLRHARSYASLPEILDIARKFGEAHRSSLEGHAIERRVHKTILDQFDADVERAWQVGLIRGLSDAPQVRPISFFSQPEPFLPFSVRVGCEQGSHIIFLLDHRHRADGIYRRTEQLAVRLAAGGKLVRIVTVADANDPTHEETVDFEEGVWKHRLVSAFPAAPPSPAVAVVSELAWGRSVAVRAALERIASSLPVDLVEDCSNSGLSLAIALNGLFNLQVYVGSEQAARTLSEGEPQDPLTVVAQRAIRIVSACGDERLWQRCSGVVKSHLLRVTSDVAEQERIYLRCCAASRQPGTDGGGHTSIEDQVSRLDSAGASTRQ